MNNHPIMKLVKRLVSQVPTGLQHELRRAKAFVDVKLDLLQSHEPEWQMLHKWLKPGDLALDIGANIGAYTLEMARLVGPTGRVISFEPILETAEVLAATVRWAGLHNVTIVNAAASNEVGTVALSIPSAGDTLLPDFYRATIGSDGNRHAHSLPADNVVAGKMSSQPVKLIKIDAEGHEDGVLAGLSAVLRHDQPVLIIEDGFRLEKSFGGIGYVMTQLTPMSPNAVFTPASDQ